MIPDDLPTGTRSHRVTVFHAIYRFPKKIFLFVLFFFCEREQILPQRLQEWNAKPCLAEERNKKELEGIRREQLEARAALEELDRRHQLLDVQVAQAKSLAVDSRQDEEAEEVHT